MLKDLYYKPKTLLKIYLKTGLWEKGGGEINFSFGSMFSKNVCGISHAYNLRGDNRVKLLVPEIKSEQKELDTFFATDSFHLPTGNDSSSHSTNHK